MNPAHPMHDAKNKRLTRQEQLAGLRALREPFPEHLISKLPRMTKPQKEDKGNHVKCDVCKGYHHRNAQHLDYVGHAALTCRLLDVDPLWDYEPFALSPDGTPLIDKRGGMWIRLTVCEMTRPGYGCAEMREGKEAGNLVKELIGDALRNAGMRFGMALDLWHKGDLHKDEDATEQRQQEREERSYEPRQTRQYRMEEPPQRQQAQPQDNDEINPNNGERFYGNTPQRGRDFDVDAYEANDWRNFHMPVGQKKGTPLGRLPDNDLWYWIEKYVPKSQYPDNLRFREALDAARAELGGESDVAVQQRNPPARQTARNGTPAQPMQEGDGLEEDNIPF
jgi:hypothetical protein